MTRVRFCYRDAPDLAARDGSARGRHRKREAKRDVISNRRPIPCLAAAAASTSVANAKLDAEQYAFDSLGQTRNNTTTTCPSDAPAISTTCYQSGNGPIVYVTTSWTATSADTTQAPTSLQAVNVKVCWSVATTFARVINISALRPCKSATADGNRDAVDSALCILHLELVCARCNAASVPKARPASPSRAVVGSSSTSSNLDERARALTEGRRDRRGHHCGVARHRWRGRHRQNGARVAPYQPDTRAHGSRRRSARGSADSGRSGVDRWASGQGRRERVDRHHDRPRDIPVDPGERWHAYDASRQLPDQRERSPSRATERSAWVRACT